MHTHMNDEIITAVYAVLHHSDPAGELRQVDRYIAHYHRAPGKFILPRKHAHLKPLIAVYVNTPDAFLALVRRIRNEVKELDGECERYEQLQSFQRVLKVRQAQRERRDRNSRMNTWMIEHRPDLTATERQRWIRQIERFWKNRRQAMLDAAREAEGGTLPQAISDALLDAFWEQVEQQITAGDLPPFKEGDDGLELYEPDQF